MTSQYVECFLKLAESHSFSQAAEELYITQPTLSKYIKALETELNMKLIDRTHREIFLTAEGRLLYDFFKDSSERFYDVVFNAKNIRNTHTEISVVILEGIEADRVIRPLIYYQLSHKNVHVTFEQLPAFQIPVYLANGGFDLAITLKGAFSFQTESKKHIVYEPFISSRQLLFYSVYHAINKLGNMLSVEDFKNETFFFPKYYKKCLDNSGAREIDPILVYKDWLGFMPKFETVEQLSAILPNVLNGSGVTILSEYNLLYSNPDIKYFSLAAHTDIAYAWCAERESNIIYDIITYTKEYFLDQNI